ncbi:hypothetical protein PS3A_40010 [Pseudomonas sp. 3A(2025)]
MLEVAVVARGFFGLGESQERALTQTEQRLIERFRQMTDQEKQRVQRLIEILTEHPESD